MVIGFISVSLFDCLYIHYIESAVIMLSYFLVYNCMCLMWEFVWHSVVSWGMSLFVIFWMIDRDLAVVLSCLWWKFVGAVDGQMWDLSKGVWQNHCHQILGLVIPSPWSYSGINCTPFDVASFSLYSWLTDISSASRLLNTRLYILD